MFSSSTDMGTELVTGSFGVHNGVSVFKKGTIDCHLEFDGRDLFPEWIGGYVNTKHLGHGWAGIISLHQVTDNLGSHEPSIEGHVPVDDAA
jgi:hypothetical protein